MERLRGVALAVAAFATLLALVTIGGSAGATVKHRADLAVSGLAELDTDAPGEKVLPVEYILINRSGEGIAEFRVKVLNKGNEASGPFSLRATFRGPEKQYSELVDFGSIPPGKRRETSILVKTNQSREKLHMGRYRFEACADFADEVDESNEGGNNCGLLGDVKAIPRTWKVRKAVRDADPAFASGPIDNPTLNGSIVTKAQRAEWEFAGLNRIRSEDFFTYKPSGKIFQKVDGREGDSAQCAVQGEKTVPIVKAQTFYINQKLEKYLWQIAPPNGSNMDVGACHGVREGIRFIDPSATGHLFEHFEADPTILDGSRTDTSLTDFPVKTSWRFLADIPD